MGKRKIEIKEIKDDRQKRSVTFTKRRDGLFKKAQTACQKFGGLQIGILVFSPTGKPFTFTNSSSSSSSSSVSVDEIIDTYMSSSSSSSTTSTSSAVVMGKRRSRSDDDDDVQVIETEKKKKRKTMNAVVTPPPPCSITVEEEGDEEKLDEGFHWDHYQNLDSDQTHDQELRNEFFFMGYGENAGIIVTEEMTMESSQFLVEGESSSHNWAPPPDVVELQEIVNVEDDFEYADDDHHHCDDETTMGLLPPSHTFTTTTSFCDLLSASDTNDEEEDYGYTLEEWEQILSTSPTVVVDTSYMTEEVEADDNWPTTQEFVQHLCS